MRLIIDLCEPLTRHRYFQGALVSGMGVRHWYFVDHEEVDLFYHDDYLRRSNGLISSEMQLIEYLIHARIIDISL